MSAAGGIGSGAGLALALALALWPRPGLAQYEDGRSTLAALGQLSIEQLSDMRVTSVLRRPISLAHAPASVYVITADDIMRSGAHTLAEVLRLAPNLDVVQLDAVSYAITARGFGGTASAANKMLVLIDGRSVYSPLFSGVFWQQNNLVLADIARIEVISGPGGTLWGANAVNGVINIVTRNSADTQGAYAEAGAGSLDQQLTLQYGGKLGGGASYRIYGMGLKRGHSERPSGADSQDRWHDLQGGFRFDWAGAGDALMLQGDLYDIAVKRGDRNKGRDIAGRWRHQFGGDAGVELQAYYDDTPSSGSGVVYSVATADVAVKFNTPLGDHNLVWGGGYRHIRDRYEATMASPPFILSPKSRHIDLGNIYVQDSYPLSGRLNLTLGSKFEFNSFSGFEFLPNARLAWRVTNSDLLWAAVSRAARTASRFDRDFVIPAVLLGGPDFDSEILVAYEAGYRGRLSDRASLSASLFYNDYSDLRAVELTDGGLPAHITNGIEGANYGLELWGTYQLAPWWRLSAGLSALNGHFHAMPGHTDFSGAQALGNDANVQGSVRTQFELPDGLHIDMQLRGVGARSRPAVRAYAEADAGIGWRPAPGFELQLSGENLLHARHAEGVVTGQQNEIPRSVFLNARLNL